MGNKSLILVEILHTDVYRHYRNELFPFIKGFAAGRGFNASWLLFGTKFEPDLARRYLAKLSDEDIARLVAFAKEKEATHLIFNDSIPQEMRAIIEKEFPGIRILCLGDLPHELIIYFFFLAENAAAGKGWLGKSESTLIDCAEPDYGRVCGNEIARAINPFIKIIYGRECEYRKSIGTNPYYDEVDLSGALFRHGCAFCYNTALKSAPYSRDPFELLFLQLDRFLAASGDYPEPRRFMILGSPIIHRIEEFFDRLIVKRFPPGTFLISCRVNELCDYGDEIERVLSKIEKSGHSLHIWNIAVENFSRAERERLNKNIDDRTISRAYRFVKKWSDAYPDVFGFRQHGGFSFILFTPWTTIEDLEINLKRAKRYGVEWGWRFLKSKLQLLPGYPISLLAEHDGLTVDSYRDLPYDAGVIQSWQVKDLPWKYRHQEIGVIYNIICRIVLLPDERPPEDDTRYRMVQDWLASLPGKFRDPFLIFGALVGVMKKNRREHNIKTILALTARHLTRHYRHLPEATAEEPAGEEDNAGISGEILKIIAQSGMEAPRFAGYTLASISPHGKDECIVTLEKDGILLSLLIEERKNARKYFTATASYAISHREDSPPDSEEKIEAIRQFADFFTSAGG
ncbi:MAG: hypothetical protein FJ088_01385 [Deltaproteobacteria bacterium]|nr:hypothetical protein [Deltaproteobacteria bacterium]